jgi:hypothetical protein
MPAHTSQLVAVTNHYMEYSGRVGEVARASGVPGGRSGERAKSRTTLAATVPTARIQ